MGVTAGLGAIGAGFGVNVTGFGVSATVLGWKTGFGDENFKLESEVMLFSRELTDDIISSVVNLLSFTDADIVCVELMISLTVRVSRAMLSFVSSTIPMIWFKLSRNADMMDAVFSDIATPS